MRKLSARSVVLFMVFLPLITLSDPRRDCFSYPTEPFDGTPWDFPQPSRVVAIGDIHADPDAMLAILQTKGLIDTDGNWIGRDTHVVFLGDILDRGPNSRFCLDFLRRMRRQAEAAGGHVSELLGNHELAVTQGDYFRYASPSDMAGYPDYMPPPDENIIRKKIKDMKRTQRLNRTEVKQETEKLRAAQLQIRQSQGFYRAMTDPSSPYAQDMRKKNAIIRIGDTLFVHAGIGEWLSGAQPAHIGRVNATLRRVIGQYQDARWETAKGVKPPKDTHWAVNYQDETGPCWDRRLAKHEFDETLAGKILDDLGVKRIVIGHTPTKSKRIESSYQGRVINIDTGISIFYNGNLSALEITKPDGKTELVEENHISRPTADHPIKIKLSPLFAVKPTDASLEKTQNRPGPLRRLLEACRLSH